MKDIFIIILILGLLFLYFLFSISIRDNSNKNKTNYKKFLNNKPIIFTKPYIENFYAVNDIDTNKEYLYPIRGLQSECGTQGLKPSYMPKACYINGLLNPYANCKCEDEEGNCKLCYPNIQKDTQNSNIVFGGDNF